MPNLTVVATITAKPEHADAVADGLAGLLPPTLKEQGGYAMPASQSPWQEIFRNLAEPLSEGMTLRGADAYQAVAQTNIPRNNH